MHDHTKPRAFELTDEVAVVIYWMSEPDISECGLELVESEKVQGALLRSCLTAFSLNNLSSY